MTDAVRSDPMQDARQRRAVLCLAGMAALYVAALAWITRDCVMDDAYIGFVFLDNLLHGRGFVFHPGAVPVEGVTNIGWLLLLAPAAWLMGPVAAAKLAGALLLLGALLLSGAIGHAAGRRLPDLAFADTLMLAPPLTLAAGFAFVYYPLAGMETAALAVAILAMAALALRRPSAAALPVLGALASTFHPEAALLFPAYLALRWPRAGRETPRGLLIYLLLLAAIAAARHAAFGAWLPNTVLAKPPADPGAFIGALLSLVSGGGDVVGFPVAGLFGLALSTAGWMRLRARLPDLAALLGAATATGLLFALYARPDWTETPRYFAPYLPAALILLWTGILDLAQRLRPGRAAPLALIGAGIIALSSLTLGLRLGALDRYPGYIMASRSLAGPAAALAQTLPPDAVIATRRIGTLAFVTRRTIFDYMYGLTEPEVAALVARRRAPFAQPGDPALAAIWQARRPGWILEDAPILEDIAHQAGGSLQRFVLHGLAYREARRFAIAPGVDWVLAERVD